MRLLEQRLVYVTLPIVFLSALVTAFFGANHYLLGKASYIDVSGPNVVYVPRTAKYVKYNGQVREIVKFATTITEAEQDCKCPNCCSGYCYVVIYTNPVPTKGQVIILSVVWLKC